MLMLMGSDEVGEEGEEVLVTCATVTATPVSPECKLCEKLYVHLCSYFISFPRFFVLDSMRSAFDDRLLCIGLSVHVESERKLSEISGGIVIGAHIYFTI